MKYTMVSATINVPTSPGAATAISSPVVSWGTVGWAVQPAVEGWGWGVQYEVPALLHLGLEAEAGRVLEASLLSRPRDAHYVNVELNLVGRLWTLGYVEWAQELLENEVEAWFALPEAERAPERLITVVQLMALGRFEEAWAMGESLDLLRDWNPRAPRRFAAYGVLAARAGHVDVATRVLEHLETLEPGRSGIMATRPSTPVG